jgi:hypothetical protein
MTGQRIGRHEPTHRTAEVPRSKVVEAGFGVAFFAGEFVGTRRVLGRAAVHIGQCVVGADGVPSFFWLKTLYLPGRRT